MDGYYPISSMDGSSGKRHVPLMKVEATYVGTATVLFRIGEVTLLTDPVFEPAGAEIVFGPGASTKRLLGPSIARERIPVPDAVLLSHDQHDDNLDAAGREIAARAGVVLSTQAAASRLGGNTIGLADWQSHVVERGATRITVTATPARHGPPMSLPIVGHVIGFLIAWEGQRHGPLYVSGDTVRYGALDEVARRNVGTAFLHMGGATFGGGVRFTMTSREAAALAKDLAPTRIFPIHTDGWSHFEDDASAIEASFRDAGLADRLVSWKRGETVAFEA